MDRHTHSAFERVEIVETGRRRRWSAAAKERIVLESLAIPGQISATARRHGISRSQLLAWRRALHAEPGRSASGFIPLLARPDPARPNNVERTGAGFPVPTVPTAISAPRRVEIVLRCGRRLLVEEGGDPDAVLKLARGLEALR